jgi:SET domain-containing protein 6
VPALLQEFYSEPLFHMMASAVLSRSFHVRKPEPGQQPGAEGAEGMVRPGDRGVELAAPADEDEEGENGDESELHIDSDSDSDADADEAENIDDVCMVPMADMLNARFETDNARVFYHLDKLEMRTTRAIEKGEQLWNTYGDPPNCDLARRYGHVDEPNGADVGAFRGASLGDAADTPSPVELPILRVVDAILALEGAADQAERRTSLLSRVEWSVAEGLDEVHALTYLFAPSSEPPHAPEPAKASSSELRAAAASVAEELLVHTRLLLLDDAAYEKVQAKGKLPNARIEAREPAAGKTLGVAEVLLKAIDLRLAEYPTSEQEDSARLYGAAGQQAEQGMSANLRAALVVRLGEKRILIDNARVLTAAHEASLKIAAAPAKGSKRKGAETAGASKKARK